MTGAGVLSAVAIIGTGLMAGMFFGWSVSVIPGTRLVDDDTYVATMRQINRAIINPGFVVPFFVTPIALLAAAIVQRRAGNDRAAVLLAAATGVYVVGLLGVTVAGNVPLNNALDAFDPTTASTDALRERRASYEGSWNRWHAIRSGAVVLAFALATISTTIDSE